MVRIRLKRIGAKGKPFYRIVVADQRAAATGKVIEQIGSYNPRPDPSEISVKNDRARYWLSQGAQPSDTVRFLLESKGIIEKTASNETK